jgi:hypothetical protein
VVVLKKDPIATTLANFACRKSYVHADGREVLYKLDWERRKFELWERCGGKCEFIVPATGLRCQRNAQHPHHKVKRSVRRDDRMENLIALCHLHHVEMHPKKQPQWSSMR